MFKRLIKILKWVNVFVIIYLAIICSHTLGELKDIICLIFLCCFVFVIMKITEDLLDRNKKTFIIVIKVMVLICIIIFALIEILIVSGYSNEKKAYIGEAEYIIILGNKLENGKATITLANRLNRGSDLYENLKIPIVVTGGNRRVNSAQEAVVMKEYLIGRGVKSEDIIVEKYATTTKENILNVSEIIGNNKKIIIVTSEIHMFRAKALADHFGFKVVVGSSTRTEPIMYLYYNLREVISIIREGLFYIIQ